MAIRIYGVVGDEHDELKAASVVAQIEEHDEEQEIDISINSPGGNMFAGVAIYNALKRSPARVVARIDALAASAATVIMCGADKVIMPENAMIMVHNPWMLAMGDYQTMQKAGEDLEKMRDALLSIYVKKTGKDEEELKAMLDEETWMTAEEALAAGFVDEIEDAVEEEEIQNILSHIDFDRFNSVPDRLAVVAGLRKSTNIAATAVKPKGKKMLKEKKTESPAPDSSPLANAEEVKKQTREEYLVYQNKVVAKCQKLGLSALDALALAGECDSLDQVNAKLIDIVAEKQSAPNFQNTTNITGGADSRDKFKEAASAAISMRAGVQSHDRKNPYRGMSLMRLAEEAVVASGQKPSTDQKQLFRQAMNIHALGGNSRSDYSEILTDSIGKTALRSYEEAEETWNRWCVTGSLSDFRETPLVALNAFDGLEQIEEGGEYEFGSVGERGERIQLGRYGKAIKISFETIVNDDLNQFGRLPQLMGRAAARVPGDLAIKVLTENSNINETGNALFSGAHNNTFNDALSYAGLDAVSTAMENQTFTDSKGNDITLGVRPANLLVPPALKTTAKQLMMSEHVGENRQQNVFRDEYQVISEHRLADDSAAKWYLTANPAQFDTVMVAFHNGNAAPFIEEKEDFMSDALIVKVRMICAAGNMDYRTLARGGDGS